MTEETVHTVDLDASAALGTEVHKDDCPGCATDDAAAVEAPATEDEGVPVELPRRPGRF